jgi:hypothetical protein
MIQKQKSFKIDPYDKVFRSKQFYTKDVEKAIKIYSINKNEDEQAHVIGSLSYRSSNASDIDLYESISKENKNKLIKFFTINIKKVVYNINKDPTYIFNELKCGLDHLYIDNINIGSCSSDSYNVNMSFFDRMKQFHDFGFISDEEYETINKIKNTITKTQIHYELIKKILRSHYVLRWSTTEVIKGYKILQDINKKQYIYTLSEAIQEKSNINVEGLLITADNKYSDVSNFFAMSYFDDDIQHMLNMSDDAINNHLTYMANNLKTSMYTLMYSKIEENLFKCLKRILSYGRLTKSSKLIALVYPIINSQLGVLYNITSQLKTIMKVLKTHGNKKVSTYTIYHQLDTIRFKLEDLIFIDYNFKEIYDLIGEILSPDTEIEFDDLYDQLDIITHDLLSYINHDTKNKMISIGLYPLPDNLIPKPKPF